MNYTLYIIPRGRVTNLRCLDNSQPVHLEMHFLTSLEGLWSLGGDLEAWVFYSIAYTITNTSTNTNTDINTNTSQIRIQIQNSF